MEHTIARNKENTADVLHRDGVALRCPFINAFHSIVNNQLGQPGLMSQHFSCSSACPHFNYGDEKKDIVRLTCSGTTVTLAITVKKEGDAPKPDLKLI